MQASFQLSCNLLVLVFVGVSIKHYFIPHTSCLKKLDTLLGHHVFVFLRQFKVKVCFESLNSGTQSVTLFSFFANWAFSRSILPLCHLLGLWCIPLLILFLEGMIVITYLVLLIASCMRRSFYFFFNLFLTNAFLRPALTVGLWELILVALLLSGAGCWHLDFLHDLKLLLVQQKLILII